MKPTIVFSSSDSSEYEYDEETIDNSNSNKVNSKKVNQNKNKDDFLVSSEDYSSEIVILKTARPTNLNMRPIAPPKKFIPNVKPKVKNVNPKIQLIDFDSSTESFDIKNSYNQTKNYHEANNKKELTKKNIANTEDEEENKNEKNVNNNHEDGDNDNNDGEIKGIVDFSDYENKSNDDINEKNGNETSCEEDDSNPPVVKINHMKTSQPITYALFRKLKQTIRGKRYYYHFYLNGTPIYCAKAKSRHPDSFVPICEGTKVHIKGESQFILTINEGTTSFSLRKGNQSGEEMLSLKFFYDTAFLNLPKHIDVEIFPCIGIPQLSLTTKSPKITVRGSWVLDFHDKFTIESEKNMIFVSSKDKYGPDLLLIRKISQDGMEIDSYIDIPEIGIFAIGLSIFLAKLH